MRAVLLSGWMIFAGLLLHAQQFPFTLKNYKAIDGLPQSQVRVMAEDKHGYLWLGTEGGGLARFDGQNFKVYTTLDGLLSNIISHLEFDQRGNLWIIHPRGITRFDGSSFVRFQQPGSKTSSTRLRRLFHLADTVFFMSSPGYIGKIHRDSIYYWSKPLFGKENEHNEQIISFTRHAPDGTLIFCINQKAFYCRREKEEFWIPFEGFSKVITAFDFENQMMIQTDNGHWVVDLEQKKILQRPHPSKNLIISYDSSKQIYWTIHGSRLLKEYSHKGSWKADTVLRDVGITQIMTDSEGNTWIGTNGNGLYKYFMQDFDRCATDKLTNVMAIYHDTHGATWIGSATKGLYRIQKGKISHYTFGDGTMPASFFYVTESSDGTIWAGGNNGLGKYNPVKDDFEWSARMPSGARAAVINIQFDEVGGMWTGTMGGGVNYKNGDKMINYSVNDGLNSNLIMSLHYSRYYKTLFVGDEFGLSSIAGQKVTTGILDGIENTSAIALQPFRDSLLLVSTGGAGLILYNPRLKTRRFITTRDGLPSDFIYFTAADEDGKLWIGSEKGITVVTLTESLAVNELLHYNDQNGLMGVETNQNAFCFFKGNKFFGLIDGVYQFNDTPRKEKNHFDVHLTDIELSYGEYPVKMYADTTSGFFHLPENLVLPPDRNHITFRFNRVSKTNPKSVKFKFMLQGFDKTWSQPSVSSSVTYSNLPSGRYTFLVMSNDVKGGWSEIPFSYEFTIITPFYARASFITGAIVLLGLVISLILYLRVQGRLRRLVMHERIRIQEQENVRKEIARDFHDEMGNQLTRIINYVSLLKLNGNHGHNGHSQQNDLYTKVEESAKYLFTGTRDFIWSIDPTNDELSKLFIHIRDFGEKLFEEKNICFRANNLIKEQVKLPYGFCREANLIFKEAMTNAFKYSGAKNVSFTLSPHPEEGFIFRLEDDGVGYKQEVVSQAGRGLKNIADRAQKINVGLETISRPGGGTSISIHFKNSKPLPYGITL